MKVAHSREGASFILATGSPSAHLDGYLLCALEIEVLEARRGAVAHVGYVLVGGVFPVLARLGEVRVRALAAAEHAVEAATLCRVEVAGYARLILALALERAAVEAAARDLHLVDGAVRVDLDFLGAGLAGEAVTVGLAMIEHVVLAVRFHDGAVRVARVVGGVLDALAPAQTHVAYADDGAAEREVAVRTVARRIAQLVAEEGRIDEVVLAVYLTHGRGFEELMSLVRRARRIALALGDVFGRNVHRHHVGLEHRHHRAFAAEGLASRQEEGIERGAETRVEVYLVTLHVHARVELEGIALLLAEYLSVGVMHVVQELVFARGLVAHRHAYLARVVQEVVEVVFAVGTAAHVGRVHAVLALGVVGILRLFEYYALVTPVGQIVLGAAPAHVVVHAERTAVEFVVTAVYVDAAVELMRLPVGYVFPAGEIGIEYLFLAHHKLLFIVRSLGGQSFMALNTPFIAGYISLNTLYLLS